MYENDEEVYDGDGEDEDDDGIIPDDDEFDLRMKGFDIDFDNTENQTNKKQ